MIDKSVGSSKVSADTIMKLVIASILFVISLTSCNTIIGVARDMRQGGEGLEKAAQSKSGGGDTGTDCVGTSIRHGCNSVVQLEIMPKPPLTRAKDNPWPEWPKVYKQDYGQEEASAKFGDDPRAYITTATKIEGDENGQVKAVHTVQVQWERNEKGQFIPKQVAGTEKVIPAQIVLLAMGFLGPEQPLLDSLGVERDPRSNVKANHGQFTTSIPKVFAAGDCRRGQSLIVWAINEGRGAARECDRYLMGDTDLP